MVAPFNSHLVLEQRISDTSLKAYCAGFDQNQFRFGPLVDVLTKVIPEFALGYHEGKSIPIELVVEKLREAAATVYTTEKYHKRGEFGELILHLLLRDFHNTIPLISKIYFKDSENSVVHGFDGVHITVGGDGKKLWLGESKLYADGKEGVKELAKDVSNHVNADFLKKEFSLLKRKIPEDTPDIQYWRDLMAKEQKLENIFSSIVIPMVCTYSSSLYQSHAEATQQYIDDFSAEIYSLNSIFLDKLIDTNVEIVLMLLPVPDKSELNTALDNRLKNMQGI
jgi:hypothetical protein